MPRKNQPESVGLSATLTIPELEQSKAAVLNTLASQHSRRSYEYAIEDVIMRWGQDWGAHPGCPEVGIWEIISEVSLLPTDRQSVGL
jgi:hypothetical protein